MDNDKDMVTLKEFGVYLNQIFKFFLTIAASCLGTIRRRWMWLSLLAALGFAMGWMLTHKSSEYYKAGLACTYNDLHRKNYGEMIVALNQYITANDDQTVATLLGITASEAEPLISVEAKNVAGAALHEDVSMEKLPFYITYNLSDPAPADRIGQGIIYYLRNCEYNKVRRKIRLENADDKSRFIGQQLEILDSLKRGYANYLSHGRSAGSEPTQVKAEDLFKESERLYNQKQDAQWVMHFDNSVEIIYSNPAVYVPAADARLRNGLMAAALLGLLGMVVFAITSWSNDRLNA